MNKISHNVDAHIPLWARIVATLVPVAVLVGVLVCMVRIFLDCVVGK